MTEYIETDPGLDADPHVKFTYNTPEGDVHVTVTVSAEGPVRAIFKSEELEGMGDREVLHGMAAALFDDMGLTRFILK